MDASNFDKSENLFKPDSQFMTEVNALYDLYNFKPSSSVVTSSKPLSFAEIIKAASEGWLSENVTSSSTTLDDDLDESLSMSKETADLFAD
jgi:hypothetical protein